jgi:hypothetical protein
VGIVVISETSFNSIVSDNEHTYSIALGAWEYLGLYVVKEFEGRGYVVRALVKKKGEVA